MNINNCNILLENSIYDILYPKISDFKLRYLYSSFKLKKISIEEQSLTELSINYIEKLAEKEYFDLNRINQTIKIKTEGIIYDFITKSHFTAGIEVANILNIENAIEIDTVKNILYLNKKYNSPKRFQKPFRFEIMIDKSLLEVAIMNYNKSHDTYFEILEDFYLEGEQFCIVSINKGTILDIFCLGIHVIFNQLN